MGRLTIGCWAILILTAPGWTASVAAQEAKTETQAAQVETLDRIAAVVNDDVILLSSVNEKCEQKFMDIPANIADAEVEKHKTALRTEALDLLIDAMLKKQKIREQQLSVNPIEVEAYVTTIMRNNKLNEEQFTEALRFEGQTLSAYKEMLRASMLDRKLMQWLMSQEGRSGLEVSDAAVADHYQTHYKQPESSKKVKASHIMFSAPPGIKPEQHASVRKRAERVLASLREGAAFEAMAKKESDDPSSAAGGALGWFRRGDMVGPFEDAAFSMKKGEMSGLVTTRFGFHIIKVTDIDYGDVLPLEKVDATIRALLSRNQEKRFMENWLKDLRRRSYIDIKL